jgi:two-component system sensor histidine kinase QseC
MKRLALQATSSRLLWRHLLMWTLLALCLIWGLLTAVAYQSGRHEADEITRGQLVATARLLLRQPPEQGDPGQPDAPYLLPQIDQHLGIYTPELHVVIWRGTTVVRDTHGLAPRLPGSLLPGHHKLGWSVQGEPRLWRAFVAETPAGSQPVQRVAVLVDTGQRDALARDFAEHIVRPALLLLPLVALLLIWVIRRGLRPLDKLSADIAALDVDRGETLQAQQPYRELGVSALAINDLVQRLQALLARERRFTADVAHELRTPLTALVWQTRLAHDTAQATSRTAALDRIEQEALKAGHILAQLLDLARAQRQQSQIQAPVDLAELSRAALADHAARAHQHRHGLTLEAPDGPVWVLGHAPLLALALRNLVDNALTHTPPGTQVELRLERGPSGAVCCSVSDDGGRTGAALAAPCEPGLGVGLALVQRIAEWEGAVLTQDTGRPPFTKRFQLCWPADNATVHKPESTVA